MIQTITRFRAGKLLNPQSQRHLQLWNAIAGYGTTKLQSRQAEEMANIKTLNAWRDEQLEYIQLHDWAGSNTQKRWIPECIRLPPALRADLAPHLESHMINIHTVNLDYNRIGDTGAALLADALKRNKMITAMHLRANSFTNRGADALIKGIERNPDMKILDIRVSALLLCRHLSF